MVRAAQTVQPPSIALTYGTLSPLSRAAPLTPSPPPQVPCCPPPLLRRDLPSVPRCPPPHPLVPCCSLREEAPFYVVRWYVVQTCRYPAKITMVQAGVGARPTTYTVQYPDGTGG